MNEKYKKLPKIDLIIQRYGHILPKGSLKTIATIILDDYREKLKSEDFDFESEDVFEDILKYINEENYFSIKSAINATGVIVHTNLGRSILSEKTAKRVYNMSRSYLNLEYNLKTGKRGSRYDHIREILITLTGAEDALIVNNNAAAVFLMLNTLAYGKNTIVSRGELVEIGESFRINEIMGKSGTKLVEVGSTNRTHLYDYENAIDEDTKIIMKVHPSDFKILGFHEEVEIPKLVNLKEENDLYIIEDLGSGSFIDLSKYGLSQSRTVKNAISEGADLVSFSCDKLLGSSQGGIIVGKKDLIAKIRKNQLLRAFRVGKLTLISLEASLIEFLDEENAIENIPTLKMICESEEDVKKRAEKLLSEISDLNVKAKIEKTSAMVGGGAYPVDEIPSYAVSMEEDVIKLEEYLRLSTDHIITTIKDKKIYFDLKAVKESEINIISKRLKEFYK